jgi:EAL domain-containing protein (putative c-di-GMP-specific phosphodiesterase class I)
MVEHDFDEVRLAPRTVREAATSADARRLVVGTVAAAHALGLPVIAVGVETQLEHDVALDAGCDLGEGNLYGAVVPAGDI